MIAGPNGSGKSTLKALLERRGVSFGLYLNADDIALTLAGDPQSIAQAAQQRVRDARDAALAERRDYCWETVMSHPSHIVHLRAARAAGYETQLLYVATDHPLISAGRVADRVAQGGHDVPTDRIVQRYERSLDLLNDALAASDRARVFDNSDADNPYRLLLQVDAGQAPIVASTDLPRWFRTAWSRS